MAACNRTGAQQQITLTILMMDHLEPSGPDFGFGDCEAGLHAGLAGLQRGLSAACVGCAPVRISLTSFATNVGRRWDMRQQAWGCPLARLSLLDARTARDCHLGGCGRQLAVGPARATGRRLEAMRTCVLLTTAVVTQCVLDAAATRASIPRINGAEQQLGDVPDRQNWTIAAEAC
jgi:hypothetical protein